jgi:hypothetical protein
MASSHWKTDGRRRPDIGKNPRYRSNRWKKYRRFFHSTDGREAARTRGNDQREWPTSENRELIGRLQAAGVNFEQTAKGGSNELAGLTFVLTGTMESLSRDKAGEEIRKRGGSVTSSVSKNTDYVVAGDKAGSKLSKAESLGIKVLDEAAFLNMLGSQTEPPKEKPGQQELF